MRLNKIRLAGFKSFVDPTTVSFPGDLIGVVGPNGCGKSNIIDAVRWVMGEVSAKHLRGDSMADVVFNGSNSRKPVSQAMVEVVFDNASGRIGGQYASYSEIAVRRQVTRDGQSAYFLNGTRCRRRDIMDVFLGTGLGPRSYAIIEQGMISRLIEARPEELREFLEEAAGISKYKERRRETENRIRHTQENLDRLSDLREELGKRLTHLKRQATVAEKYKVLKADERLLRAQLLALRWRALDAESAAHDRRIGEQETALEAVIAEQRHVEAALDRAREAHGGASEAFNETYRQVLDAGAEIARVEEAMQHLRERREQLRESLARETRTLAEARRHVDDEASRLGLLSGELEARTPELEALERAAAETRDELARREATMQDWQVRWEALAQEAAEPAQLAEAERARILHLEEQLVQVRARTTKLEGERGAMDTAALEASIAALGEAAARARAAGEQAHAELQGRQEDVRTLRERISGLSTELHRAREQAQALGGRLASLQALQQDALGKGGGAAMEWLRAAALDGEPRLAEALQVETGWERAVECVLGAHLEAVCVAGLDGLAGRLGELHEGALSLFETAGAGAAPPPAGQGAQSLADKVQAPWPVAGLFAGVYAVETLEEALALRPRLGAGESAVTRQGERVGRAWLRIERSADAGAGVLAREQAIRELAAERGRLDADLAEREAALAASRDQLREAEDDVARLQSAVADGHRRDAEARARVGAAEAQLEQARVRAAAVGAELEELAARADELAGALAQGRRRLAEATGAMERVAAEREDWGGRRQALREAFEEARERWHAVRDQAYQVGLKVEGLRTQIAGIEQGRARNRDQVEQLEMRCEEQREALAGTDAPLDEHTRTLEERLVARRQREEEMKSARERVEALDAEVRRLDQQRHGSESRVQAERSALEALRMQRQEVHVRRQTVAEQVSGAGHALEALLEGLGDDARESEWQDQLEQLEGRIARLGPINLAAIEEHAQQAERKTYLDAQHEDLAQALETLQNAIQKIDRETRARFKDTYERVNEKLGEIFPKLFGGGAAYLEMTGDDLLSTGIAVMARPPGKRNSTIHLLSGGEKALTAVSLVFSIFHLNPAPFCLLDEVDAPLDDANVGRFCELVKQMSEQVQCMLVTHNKTTMEMSQQLIGVTMHEPGVSRLVAVDVDEAVEMAAV